MQQTGLDERYRDKDGPIAKKYGKTSIAKLRLTYPDFAPLQNQYSKLIDVLDKLDEPSLLKLIKDTPAE
jgi:hypothetical protein